MAEYLKMEITVPGGKYLAYLSAKENHGKLVDPATGRVLFTLSPVNDKSRYDLYNLLKRAARFHVSQDVERVKLREVGFFIDMDRDKAEYIKDHLDEGKKKGSSTVPEWQKGWVRK